MESASATQNRRRARSRRYRAGNRGSTCASVTPRGGMLPAPWGRRPPSAPAQRQTRAPHAPGLRRSPPPRCSPWRSQRAAATSRARTRTSPPATSRWRSTRRSSPTHQRLAETNDLQLEIENTGDKQVPDLAVTIFTGDEKSSGSFSVRSDQPGLADPNRPVWILENGFPKVAKQNETGPELDELPPGGAEAAQTDTFVVRPARPGRAPQPRLAGDPGGRRHLHRPLRARRRPQRQGEGRHRRRRPGRGRVRGHDQRQAAAGAASTTTATW